MILDTEIQKQLRLLHNPDGSGLRTRQLELLKILDVVDDICKQENIQYWLSSGTLLGAVRHGGFIPWDDDIDIDICYSDMRKFIKACKDRLPSEYVLQNHDSDPKYINNILKIREKASSVHEKTRVLGKEFIADYNYNGLFIDILPVEPSFKVFIKISRVLMTCLGVAKYRLQFNDKLLHCLYSLANGVYGIFRYLSKLFKADKCYVSYGCYFIGERKIEEILPVSELEFEGKKYSVPHDWHSYLTRLYGDYIALPDAVLRMPSHE